ncbi:MAG TPA: hypothetical protein VGD50_04220 [Candidatus Baltobacteraceae bacterium]
MARAHPQLTVKGTPRSGKFAFAAPARLAKWQHDAIDALAREGLTLVGRIDVPPEREVPITAAFRRIFARSAALLDEWTGLVPAVDAPLLIQTPATAAGLDVVLWFSPVLPNADFAQAVRYGVWRTDCGQGAGVPGVAEMLVGARTIAICLERLRSEPAGEIIYEAIVPLRPTSLLATITNAISAATQAPRIAYRRVCARESAPSSASAAVPARSMHETSATQPKMGGVAGLAYALACARARAVFERITGLEEAWRIGILSAADRARLQESPEAIFVPRPKWLGLPAHDRFWADSFALEIAERTFLLCEVFPAATQRGVIACVELRDNDIVGAPQTVLEKPHHLSYPYVIADGDRRYCAPESFEARCVTLYDVGDPFCWMQVAVLIDEFAAVDSTIIFHEGRWWLFCTNADTDANADLYIWHAPALTGPWQQHAANPVKSDVTSARPAGTPFVRDGTLYRPAQDCSNGYGSRIVLNRIIELSLEGFQEVPVGSLEPAADGPCPYGMHTVALGKTISFVDGKERRRSARGALRALTIYVRRVTQRAEIRTRPPS